MTANKHNLRTHHRSRTRLILVVSLVITGVLAVTLTTLSRAPWSGVSSLDTFNIGYSAPADQRVTVLRAEANDGVRMLGSSVGAWGEVGGTVGYYDQPMPEALQITWSAEDTGAIYRAETELPDDLTARAARLPAAVREWDGRESRSPHLIIGMKDDGAMTVWLSNAVQDYRFEGRILEVVAEAQGRRIEEDEVHP